MNIEFGQTLFNVYIQFVTLRHSVLLQIYIANKTKIYGPNINYARVYGRIQSQHFACLHLSMLMTIPGSASMHIGQGKLQMLLHIKYSKTSVL